VRREDGERDWARARMEWAVAGVVELRRGSEMMLFPVSRIRV
jgi:hypothetical protein